MRLYLASSVDHKDPSLAEITCVHKISRGVVAPSLNRTVRVDPCLVQPAVRFRRIRPTRSPGASQAAARRWYRGLRGGRSARFWQCPALMLPGWCPFHGCRARAVSRRRLRLASACMARWHGPAATLSATGSRSVHMRAGFKLAARATVGELPSDAAWPSGLGRSPARASGPGAQARVLLSLQASGNHRSVRVGRLQ